MSGNFLKRYMGAFAKDSIAGFEKYIEKFVPKNMLYELGTDLAPYVALPSRTPPTLSWSRKDWPKFYHQEHPLLELKHHGRPETLDTVLLASSRRSSPLELVYDFDRTLFTVDKHTAALTSRGADALIRNSRVFNGCNVRLKEVRLAASQLTLFIQPVLYHDYVRSNLSLDFRASVDAPTLREQIHSAGRLEDFAVSVLANHIGVNMLVFTGAGKLIIPTRSSKAIFRGGEFTSSSSGTLEPADLHAESHFAETHKELGVLEQRALGKPQFLGLTRELVRGGQPEMFFTVRVDQTEDEIWETWRCAQERDESETLRCYDGFGRLAFADLTKESDRLNFLSSFDRLIDLVREKASLPLLTNLSLWRDFMLDHPATARLRP